DHEHCDELRLDLDPQPGTDFMDVRRAAGELKALLDELGLVGYPKTTGNRGLHVYVRLEPRWDSYAVRAAAVAVARELERRPPASMRPGRGAEKRAGGRGSPSPPPRPPGAGRSPADGHAASAAAARSRRRCAGRRSSSSTRTS